MAHMWLYLCDECMDLELVVNCMVRLALDRKLFALNYGIGYLLFFYFAHYCNRQHQKKKFPTTVHGGDSTGHGGKRRRDG